MISGTVNNRITSSAPRALIVDGHALAYRMYYALPEMISPSGEPTQAIFGFIKSLRRTVETLLPTHGAVVWDGGLSTMRLELLPEYKGQRPPMPDAFRRQLTPLQNWVSLAGWPCLLEKGIEADDLIGVLAAEAEAAGAEVYIMSADKDFMQLVTDRVHLWRDKGGKVEVVTPQSVLEKTGVRPDQIVDWLSLIGDSSDNIAGVPGIGPRTAARLLNEFGSIYAMYENIERVKPVKIQLNRKEKRDLLLRNQKLIRLSLIPEYKGYWEKMKLASENKSEIVKFLNDFGLKSLLRLESQQQPPVMMQAELF